MKSAQKREIARLRDQLRNQGPAVFHCILSAMLIWLFGVLVFIPIAMSIGQQTTILVTLAFFAAFTILVARALPGMKGLIDASCALPARKYCRRLDLDFENSLLVFRQLSYIIGALILYLLYYPFLSAFHPAISGLALILVLIWTFLLVVGTSSILSDRIREWLYPAKVR